MGDNSKKKKNTRAGKKQEKENRNQGDLHRQQLEYWNDYYGKQGRGEDFYKDEWDTPYFSCIISSLSLNDQGQKKDIVTLVPGCGMSSLSMKLHFLEGCKFKVVNIDISKKVIEEMKKLDKDNNWNMSWEEMSMDKMDKFEDGYFHVIIDKAASDFILPPNHPQTSLKFQQQRLKFLSNYLSEVRRLLKVGGTFIYFLALEVRGECEKTCLDSMLVYFRRGWDVIIHGPGDGKQPIQNGKLNMVMVLFTKTTSQGDPSMVKWDIHMDCYVGKTLKLFQVVELENEKRGYLSIYSEGDPKSKWNHNNKWISKGPENISSHRRLHFNLGKYEGLDNGIKYNALLFDIHKDDESQSRNYSVLCVPEKILREWHALSREDQLRFVLKLNTTRLLMIFSGKWSNDDINWERAIRKHFSSSLSKLAPKKREDEVVIRRFCGSRLSRVEAKDFPDVGQVKLERKGGNHELLPQKNPTGKNFFSKTNTEAQDPSFNQKTRDEETPPKETKDPNVLVQHNTGNGQLGPDNDKIYRGFIGFCVNHFEDMGSTAAARTLEKESGYFSRKHVEDLVECHCWKLLDYYLSHFFDIGKSAMLTKIESWAFVDDLKRRGLPLPEPKWFEPDYPQKESISSELEELIRGKLKMRDELKLAHESVLWCHFTKSQTCEGSDLVGAHQGERKVVYKKFEKMTIFDKILVEGKSIQVREGVYENKPAMIKCIDLVGEFGIHKKELPILMELEGHENVVKYYGVEWGENSCYIALEKCSFSLHDLFDKEKNFGTTIKSTWDPAYPPPTMLLSLIKDIIKGLDYLHSHDLIHGGLNPSNIMIKEECGKFCAKLSNMGLSKRLGGASSTTSSPKDPAKIHFDDDDDTWKSPEQKRKEEKVGRYVDLYSLGYIIHFCLTGGKHPQDDDPTANMENWPMQQLLYMLVEDFPEAYDIVSQLMSPQKNKRPSAKQVLKHPFFWASHTRNEFMRYASDWLDDERENYKNSHTTSPILAKLQSRKVYMFGNRWDDKIDADFVTYLRENEPYIKFHGVFDLVRVIRNKPGHFLELQKNVKKDLIPGGSAHRVEEYFVRKFPKVLLEVYKIVLEFWEDVPTFQFYFT